MGADRVPGAILDLDSSGARPGAGRTDPPALFAPPGAGFPPHPPTAKPAPQPLLRGGGALEGFALEEFAPEEFAPEEFGMEGMDRDDPRVEDAVKEAARARDRAYAPYSRFRMGAAVVTDRNAVVPGALVENVSLGLAMCAERSALFGVVAADLGRPEILALVAPRTAGDLTWPCGACLQVALELGGPDLLIAVSDGSRTERARLAELAPSLPFKDRR